MKLGHATTEYRRKNSEASRKRGEGRTGILDGRQPGDLTAEKLLEHSRLPLAWR
jgi:hypothetical protein